MIIKSKQDEIQNYLIDASNFKGFCDKVYLPETINEIREIMLEANSRLIPVTVSGNGTGLTGSRVPQGGIVISTEKLNKILEINKEKMYALVESGVLLSDLLSELKINKLLYPPDPTEKNCFIGGTVATNASGEKTFRYGSTRDYIIELEIVLANGELLHLKREEITAKDNTLVIKSDRGTVYKFELPDLTLPITKNAAGYHCLPGMDAIDLFIGSEGTLGLITKAKLKLLPYPEKLISCIVFFEKEIDSLFFLKEARRLSYLYRKQKSELLVDALALEYFDSNSLKFLLPDFPNIPAVEGGAVWFEQETTMADEERFLEDWTNLIRKSGGNDNDVWFAFSEKENERIHSFRHRISTRVNEFITKNNFRKLGTDIAVPDQSFEELYYFSKSLAEQAGINYVVYGHFGNSHMHVNFLPETESQFEKSKELYRTICVKAIGLKGTVSAEHGIGKIKKEYLPMMYGQQAVHSMFAIKKILDPNLILGRGNLFEDSFLR